MKKEVHPIREAERYLQNAKQMLSEKAKKEGNYYEDTKYVKLAGHAAWTGVLIALDAVLGTCENMKKSQRLGFKDYMNAIAQKDGKMTNHLLVTYELCHKVLGYDGNPSYKVVKTSLEEANYMVKWADKNYQH
ncbi:MAG: DUF5618 family protein [Candidatus Symbiothrix sp.]|jgi:hypothetical protein|nr:DUF5618 family protein [Candidatus Symbiothrix sp.]